MKTFELKGLNFNIGDEECSIGVQGREWRKPCTLETAREIYRAVKDSAETNTLRLFEMAARMVNAARWELAEVHVQISRVHGNGSYRFEAKVVPEDVPVLEERGFTVFHFSAFGLERVKSVVRERFAYANVNLTFTTAEDQYAWEA